jgi:glyoxylase-like metal-dependent hydrolase (beta-lactamase superfamily II)
MNSESLSLGAGTYRITLPLPFPDPIAVNCYLFEGDDGLTLLDCGVDGPTEHDVLARAFERLGFAMSDLHRLVASHLHVDHMGMAKRVMEAHANEWVMHTSAEAEIPHYNDWEVGRVSLARTVQAAGAPEDAIERFRREWVRPEWFSQAVKPSHPVEDGDQIPLSRTRHLEVIYTPGHQANHMCLLDSQTGRLFSGDHVLPRISPFIPYTGEDQDHLRDYLGSLDRITKLEVRETFPGHGPTIERGSARAHQIHLHHQRRLDIMLDVLAEHPATPWHVMQNVFRPNLSPLEERLAFQETMAHLEYLRGVARVNRTSLEGVWWYRTGS